MNFIFNIPYRLNDLLKSKSNDYKVNGVLNIKELPAKIKDAKTSYRENGPEYILEHFDVYFSVLHHQEALTIDKVALVYNDVVNVLSDLHGHLQYILDGDEELDDEIKLKCRNIIKMLVYLFSQLFTVLDNYSLSKQRMKFIKKRTGNDDDSSYKFDPVEAIISVNKLLQCETYRFWDSSIVEEKFVQLIAEICHTILSNPSVTANKELRVQTFNIFGILITNYHYDKSLILRLIQLLKMNGHLINTIAEGIKQLVKKFSAKQLVHEFIEEIMQYLMDEKTEECEGVKHCTGMILEMSKVLPELMVTEIADLFSFLNHESIPLRVSIIAVITEVLLIILSKPELSTSEQNLKSLLVDEILTHIHDVAANVRTKTIQAWMRLQKENAVEKLDVNKALKEIVIRLKDKSCFTRRAAVACINSFLQCNPYGSELSLRRFTEEHEARKQELTKMYDEINRHINGDVVTEWKQAEKDILEIVQQLSSEENEKSEEEEEEEEEGDDNEGLDNQQHPANMSVEKLFSDVETCLKNKSYKDAVKLIKTYLLDESRKEILKNYLTGFAELNGEKADDNVGPSDNNCILELCQKLYFKNQLVSGNVLSNETLEKINTIERSVAFFNLTAEFCSLLQDANSQMKTLLKSVNITDMQEAVHYFILAYQFKLDMSENNLLELLALLKLSYEDRKKIVTDALHQVLLVTGAQNMREHVEIVVSRLIGMLKIITYDKKFCFESLITQWTASGKLDNNVIETLFAYFTRRAEVSEETSLAAIKLLTMAARARNALVTNNLEMVNGYVFEGTLKGNALFVADACNFLSVAGSAEVDVNADHPPYRVDYTNPIWNNVTGILCDNFTNKNFGYDIVTPNAIKMIYYLCSYPEKIIQDVLSRILKLECWGNKPTGDIPIYLLVRMNNLVSEIAIYELLFLDETAYKELKRRNNMKTKRGKQSDDTATSASVSSKRYSKTEDNGLEGAQAGDCEADYIVALLEYKVVTNDQFLGRFRTMFLEVCENLDKFPDEELQLSSVLALVRFMVVSSKFCKNHIQTVFAALNKTKYTSVKRIIVIHMADLLQRYPNIIDPHMSKIFNLLDGNDNELKKIAFFILANLITRDMLRVNNKVYMMVLPIHMENTELGEMSRDLFRQLSSKDSKLNSILPDIFSFLCDRKDVTEEHLQYIMRYLFSLIDKAKNLDSLIDRFCTKLTNNDDENIVNQIGFCLTLFEYNVKAAKRLVENFDSYRDALHFVAFNRCIKEIVASWNRATKINLKDIANELQSKIDDFFKVKDQENEDPQTPGPSKKSNKSSKASNKKKKTQKKSRYS